MRQGVYVAGACLNGTCEIPGGIRETLKTQVGPRRSWLLQPVAAVQGGTQRQGSMHGLHGCVYVAGA